MGKGNKLKDRQINQNNKKNDRVVKGALRKRRERSKHGDEKWKQGLKAFGDQLEPQGLCIKDVAGDGNCLFRAISDQLEDSPNNHMKYRKEIVAFIELNKDMYAPFIDDEEYETFEEYLQDMRLDGTWGGNVEVQSCSLIYGVNVVIHQIDQPRWEITNHVKPKKIVHLSYHNGEHYASVRPINETFFPAQKQASPTANLQQYTFADLESNKEKDKKSSSKDNKDSSSSYIVPISNSNNIDPEIYEIMVATGVKSVKLIKEALEDCQYNNEAAIDYLISLSAQIDNFGMDEDEDDKKTTTTTTTTTTTSSNNNKNEKVSKNPYKGIKKKENDTNNNNSNSNSNEHLSNKQRKQLNNNSNANANNNKKKQNHNVNINDIVDDTAVVNLGSLNI